MAMQLREIGDTRVVIIHPDESLDRAITLMEQNGFRHLPVVDKGRPVGMVSDRDLMSAVGWLRSEDRAAVKPGQAHVGAMRVSEIMTTPVICMSPEGHVQDAVQTMLNRKIRAIPLVWNERLAGIVTKTDLLKCFLDDRAIAPRVPWRMSRVCEHMTRDIITLLSKDSIRHAIRVMDQHNIRHLPIVESRRLVGIVSDHDVRRAIGRQAIEAATEGDPWSVGRLDLTMIDIMTREVQTLPLDAPLVEAAERMVRHRFGCLPVGDGEGLQGIISESDLLRALEAACRLGSV